MQKLQRRQIPVKLLTQFLAKYSIHAQTQNSTVYLIFYRNKILMHARKVGSNTTEYTCTTTHSFWLTIHFHDMIKKDSRSLLVIDKLIETINHQASLEVNLQLIQKPEERAHV